MFKIFKKPHPFIFNRYSIIIPCTITFLIIAVLAPLSFQELNIKIRVVSASVIALIVGLSIYVSLMFLKWVFPKSMSEDNWTVGKEFLSILLSLLIIMVLILIAVLNFKVETAPLLPIILKTIFITLVISVFPVIFLVLFEQYRHQKTQLEKANELTISLINKNKELSKTTSERVIEEQSILIKSESDDIELILKPDEIVYIKSDGNYVEVHFLNVDKVQRKLVRNRIKNIETILPHTSFLRCHNRFIVNGNAIIKVEGNARNLLLHLKNITEAIPVSRAKASLVSDFIHNLNM